MPAGIEACFSKHVKLPKGALNRKAVVRLIAQLKRSEVAKSQCGRRLVAWYDSIAKGLGQ